MCLKSIDDLKELLNWKNINSRPIPGYSMQLVRISPQKTGPSIELVFDQDLTCLEQLGFGEKFHCHPEIDEAVVIIDELIKQRRFLCEEIDKDGKYIGGGLYEVGKVPDTLSQKAESLRITYFNSEPRLEKIDFTRYQKGKHLLVRKKYLKKLEEMYRDTDMTIPEF